MLTYFFKDKTTFRRNMLLCITASAFMASCSMFFYNNFVNLSQANNKARATYEAQAEWYRNYDYEAVRDLEKVILKPVKASELEKVQKEQLELFSKHGLNLVSVRKGNVITKSKLKSAATSVVVEGKWENITALLNEFEKNHLVVITSLNLSTDKNIVCKMDYSIYYN